MTPGEGTAFTIWLKQRRTALGLTHAELAQQVACSRIEVLKLEAGERRPSKHLATRLASVLGVPPGEQEAFVQFARGGLPAHAWQSLGSGERAAPWRSLQRRPNNLPAPITAFLGRETVISAVHQWLNRTEVRLLTLTGPPGIGKTRLSLAVADVLLPEMPDGAFFVELGNVKEPDLVAAGIAQALELRESSPRPLLATLKHALHSRRLLLILDNFEQVLDAAPLVTDLLGAARALKILVSSREPLHVYGEHLYPVPPLSLPEAGVDLRQEPNPLPVERLLRYDAIRLFSERAMAVRPDFVLTRDNAPLVTDICRHLGGVPLAIELAAARLSDLPLEAIAGQLAAPAGEPGSGALSLLVDEVRDRSARQHTLRGAIQWSYALLAPAERTLFEHLAVFAGAFTVEAVQAVSAADDEARAGTAAGLASLLDKSLLIPSAGSPERRAGGPQASFSMLEGIREFARERLEAGGSAPAVRRRHARYFLDLAETARSQLQGDAQAAWLERLAREHDNMRAALDWAISEHDSALALRLAAALWKFWMTRGHLSEGRRWLAAALALEGAAAEPLRGARAGALNAAGNLASASGDYGAARALYSEALELRRALGDSSAISGSLNNLALVAQVQGDYGGARALHEESLQIKRALGDRWGIASTLGNLGALLQDQGEYAAARRLHEESLAVRRELGDQAGVALALYNLGMVLLLQEELAAAQAYCAECLELRRALGDQLGIAGALNMLGEVARGRNDMPGARALYEDSLAICRALGDHAGMANALSNLGYVLHRQGQNRRACALFCEALQLREAAGDRRGIAECLGGLAGLAASRGSHERAARLFGAMQRLLEDTGIRVHPFDRHDHERSASAARRHLGKEAWDAALDVGRALTLEQAVAEALQEPCEN